MRMRMNADSISSAGASNTGVHICIGIRQSALQASQRVRLRPIRARTSLARDALASKLLDGKLGVELVEHGDVVVRRCERQGLRIRLLATSATGLDRLRVRLQARWAHGSGAAASTGTRVRDPGR